MSRAKRFIPKNHELIQILHHAFVYNLSLMLLLIGDSKGTIIRGVWVSFDSTIFEVYKGLLQKCYVESLQWAYEEDEDNEENSLGEVRSALPSFIDFDSFQDYFNLWRCAIRKSSDYLLPIPPTDYIIPFHFSKWNKFKGGSDTLTKLFWNSKHYVPSDSPAAYAVSRLLRLLATIIFRCEAIMTSKEDLSFYDSLLNWRNANNKRQQSFDSFLRQSACSFFFKTELVQDSPQSPQTLTQPTMTRNSRNRILQVDVPWLPSFTGKTPCKNVNLQYEEKSETLESDVVKRRERCIGHCVFRVNIDKDGKEVLTGEGTVSKCALCKKNTRHYCTQCHTWLCGPSTAYHNNDNKKSVCVYTDTATGKVIRFRQSCSHIFHEQGLTKAKEDNSS